MATKKPAKKAPAEAPATLTDEIVDPRHKPEEALRLIKEAHGNPRQFTLQEALEFIAQPIDMGWPSLPAHAGRGPKPKRTQYELAAIRRLRTLRRILQKTKLKTLRSGKGKVPTDRIIELLKELLASTDPRVLVATISIRLDDEKLYVPDDSTIRKIIKPFR